ncbi:MAG TPA: DciA family protein, partial [Acidimicrobiales bacterium]|nr:DciA family protein [Acidimicrobiales bacterium]
MRRRGEEPARLGDVLDALAARIRRVDLRAIDDVRERWPGLVDATLAQSCRPEFVKSGTLVVSAPTGAHA